MTTAALLAHPSVATMSNDDVFRMLKRSEVVRQIKNRLSTTRDGRTMFGSFAELADFDAELNSKSGN
jgi:hypothetical protein